MNFDSYRTRRTTNKLLELCEEGVLDTYQVLLAALNYMSESDVADMAESNEFLEADEEEDEDDEDSDEEE
jgi:hypothetical protein